VHIPIYASIFFATGPGPSDEKKMGFNPQSIGINIWGFEWCFLWDIQHYSTRGMGDVANWPCFTHGLGGENPINVAGLFGTEKWPPLIGHIGPKMKKNSQI
jgi:hypothetical protein